jgi:putative toxin-antitoxin system antitoxin component (TIGR02293 family)
MAHTAKVDTDGIHRSAPSRDLERFRRFLSQGAPGPYAYVVLLGMETFEPPALFRALRKGFPYRAFERFSRNSAMPAERVMALIDVPRRTLTRRKREGRFLPSESDRLLRASRLFAQALALFEGDRDAATDWLDTAQRALGGAAPLDLARTEVGMGEVERLIGRLEHGVFS